MIPSAALGAGDANSTSCPNEALRTGPSAALPDCRAYEQVTPAEKEGSKFYPEHTGPGPEGTADLELKSWTALPGSENNDGAEGATYSTVRTAAGWVTTPLSPSATEYQLVTPGGSLGPLVAESLDQRSELFLARADWQPDNRLDFIIKRPTGAVEDVGPVTPPNSPATPPEGPIARLGVQAVGESDDFSHILFSLEPEALRTTASLSGHSTKRSSCFGLGNQGNSLYEYIGANNTAPMMVGVNESGKLISRCQTSLGGGIESQVTLGNKAAHNAMSADGGTVFFTAAACEPSPKVNELYARIDNGQPGAHTVAISEPSAADCEACDTSGSVQQPAFFEAASEDGSKAFFTTTQPLLEGAAGENLYEYDFDAPTGYRVIRVTAGDSTVSNPTPGLEGVSQISEDGSHVYFVASGVLTTTPNSQGQVAHTGANNFYVYERDTEYPEGRTAFIADLSNKDHSLSGGVWYPIGPENGHEVDLTPDGRFMVFRSSTPHLTADDTSTAPQLFEYDAQTGSLVRISIGQNGFNDNGNTDSEVNEELQANLPAPHGYYSGKSDPDRY